MPLHPNELQFQAQKNLEAIQTSAPERAQGVGVVILFFNRGGDRAVGFATNAVTNDEKRQTVDVLRQFAQHVHPDRLVAPIGG